MNDGCIYSPMSTPQMKRIIQKMAFIMSVATILGLQELKIHQEIQALQNNQCASQLPEVKFVEDICV